MPNSPRYVVEAPASVKDSYTGTIWYTFDVPAIAQAVADGHSRADEARAAGCTNVCDWSSSAGCVKCWSGAIDKIGIPFWDKLIGAACYA